MRIAYTINGEGMGHASRSSVVIEHLLSAGHTVNLFSAGERPVEFLRKKFGSVAEVTGLHLVYYRNRVRRMQTALKALTNMRSIRRDFELVKNVLEVSRPDVVITDFDFHGEIIARYYQAPIISIDNIQVITQAKLKIPPEDFLDYEINYAVARLMVPRADFFFITSFFYPTLRNRKLANRVFFIPPLLRRTVLETKPTHGSHILVYQTSDSYSRLLNVLAQSGERCYIYNFRKIVRHKNLVYRKFTEEGFIADLASARAVIVNGGFNVITESIFFKKPILSVPIQNHFEQRLNGMMLQELGYGVTVKRISNSTLRMFLSRLGRYERTMQDVSFDAGSALKKIDSILDLAVQPKRR